MPEALKTALEGYREAFREMGVVSLSRPRLEADDVIATLACKVTGASAAATILSTDKIFLALLPRGVRVRDHFKGADFDAQHVIDKFGVRPDQLVDFLALAGDRGNGIHGVPASARRARASSCPDSRHWRRRCRRRMTWRASSVSACASARRRHASAASWSVFAPISRLGRI